MLNSKQRGTKKEPKILNLLHAIQYLLQSQRDIMVNIEKTEAR
jgi:hypothetical protein